VAAPHWGPGAKPLVRGQGRRPAKAESNLKTKLAILRFRFDYLTFLCFEIFRLLLLTSYAANMQTTLYWEVNRMSWSRVLGAGSFMFGAICGI